MCAVRVVSLGFLAVWLLACSGGVGPRACPPTAPDGYAVFDTASFPLLAGDFELRTVATSAGMPATPVTTRIHLYLQDSTRRFRFMTRGSGRTPGERPIAGWVVSPRPDPRADTSSFARDPEQPGIEWVGRELYMGWGRDMLDGMGTAFRVEAVSPNGFWGSWREDMGMGRLVDRRTGEFLPDPSGYFCADRIRP